MKISRTIYKNSLFFISPILSIPLILVDIYKRKEIGIMFFCLFLSLLSFYYIEHIDYDKVYYVELYHFYRQYEINDFLKLIVFKHQDFIFYSIIFFFASIGLPFQFTSAFVTFITTYFIFSSFHHVALANSLQSKKYFYYFLLVLFSLSLLHLFSGIRFYLGASFVIYVFFNAENKSFRSNLMLLILAGFTHFSLLLFIPVFIVTYSKKKKKLLRLVYIISLIIAFLPKERLLNSLNLSYFNEFIQLKVSGYLSGDDIIESQIKSGSMYYRVKIVLHQISFVIMNLIILLRNRKFSSFSNIVLIISVSNLFYSSPVIYERLLVLSVFSMIVLFISLSNVKNKLIDRILKSFFIIIIISYFLLDFTLLYRYFRISFLDIGILFFWNILFESPVNVNDFVV